MHLFYKRTNLNVVVSLSVVIFCGSQMLFARNNDIQKVKLANDSILIKSKEKTESKSNRNVMLNASDNTSPRDINIGLPTTLGGISILENDLPVVYYFWPDLPNRSWRQSVGLSSTGLLKMDQVAATTGELGYAVNSYSQTGTKKFKLKANFSTDSYGLLQGDVNVSGPLTKNGWSYTAGAYLNFDPNTYDKGFTKYSDKTQIYRVGLTKFFKNNRGQINFQYKYSNSYSITNYGLFEYKEGGKVKETDFFKIGKDSYLLNDGTARFKDLKTGDFYTAKLNGTDATTITHNFSIFGNYLLNNGWNFKFSTKLHKAKASILSYIPTGIKTVDKNAGYSYMDGTSYSGYVGGGLAQSSPRNPVTDVSARLSINKQIGNHDLTFGTLELYHKELYTSNRSFFYQTVEDQPQHLLQAKADKYGYYNYNVGSAYYDGHENELSIYGNDKWRVNRSLNFNYGLYLRNHTIRGKYTLTPRTPGFNLQNAQLSKIDDNLYNIAGFMDITYNITKEFGLLGNFQYSETNGGLENYNLAAVPNMKKQKIPVGALGIFWNNKYIQLISQITYLHKNNYLTRYNMVNPDNSSDVRNVSIYYDIQTLGWTTDFVLTPFKGAQLHYLITLQNPQYKDFKFNIFGRDYDYSDKNVLQVSKMLMEIDPSYSFGKWKVWASFRYYSKQFANLTNVLYFAPHWETFGGVNFNYNKHIRFQASVINFLNQRGASGSINGAELITDPTPYYGKLMTGSYIMPLTFKFSTYINF